MKEFIDNIKKISLNFDLSEKKIAIIYGGKFEESEVSVVTANAFKGAIQNEASEILMIDAKNDIIDEIKTSKPDCILNAMHGTFGEDGRLQAILDYLKIPYTHSGFYASFIAMNKELSKNIFKQNEIPVPNGFCIGKEDIKNGVDLDFYFQELKSEKIVIKPNDSGSSVGVQILKKGEKINPEKIRLEHHNSFLIEEFIDGIEISVPVFLDKAIGVLELSPKDGAIYDYEHKYTDGLTEHIYPARMAGDFYNLALKYAEIAHKSIECKTVSRADFRFNPKKNILKLLEINTHPGATELSIVPDVLSRNGLEFKDFVKILIKDASYTSK